MSALPPSNTLISCLPAWGKRCILDIIGRDLEKPHTSKTKPVTKPIVACHLCVLQCLLTLGSGHNLTEHTSLTSTPKYVPFYVPFSVPCR